MITKCPFLNNNGEQYNNHRPVQSLSANTSSATRTMQLFGTVFLISLHITSTPCKHRHHINLHDGSIENIFYYQDVKHNPENNYPIPLKGTPWNMHDRVESPTTKPACCPKLCCSSCCGDCHSNNPVVMHQFPPTFFNTNGNNPVEQINPLDMKPDAKPDWSPSHQKYYDELKNKTLHGIQHHSGRRQFVDTKDNIRGLIAQDEDIKRILKELVRVTMQKVTLVEQLKEKQTSRRVMDVGGTETKDDTTDDEYQDYNNGDENVDD
ncbi:hypothetical protein JYU34_004312 [Plutella xylostella]|uniref:Uncharacterized protein n=1 Tax=Plutella xylostella TaxID=51655 RepID=A0ABQ7QXP7_PLUXY|nr:hypothetical protein JYU34_004312 [Plutella xylostella]